jgi:tetrahydromethanopterin S-methyltransferase subunit G
MKKSLLIASCLLSFSFAQNINYARGDIQTLTLPKNKIDIYGSMLKMNDTLDVLDIKQKEFGGTANYDAIGDLNGYDIGIRYGLLDDLSLFYNRSKQQIEYSSNEISNTKDRFFLRYNLFNNNIAVLNSGVSIDFGFETNRLEDFYYNDFTTINTLIKKVLPNDDASLKYSDGITPFSGEPFARAEGYYAYFNHALTQLSDDPYIALKDTSDRSSFIRFLTGYYTKNSSINFYFGLKNTKIKSLITTTDEILSIAKTAGFDLNRRLDRDENMLFAGFSITKEKNGKIVEFSYEYDRFDRDDDLGYIDFNHVINIGFSKVITKNLLFFVNGKLLYRQFNGEIPYLYNQYTQTSYDHKYGYTQMGIMISF